MVMSTDLIKLLYAKLIGILQRIEGRKWVSQNEHYVLIHQKKLLLDMFKEHDAPCPQFTYITIPGLIDLYPHIELRPYGNDACVHAIINFPCPALEKFEIWIDSEDRDQREFGWEAPRFSIYDHDNDETVIATDYASELILKVHELIEEVR